MTTPDPLLGWKLFGVATTFVIVASVPAWLVRQAEMTAARADAKGSEPTFVGREKCRSCHEKEYKSWRGSDHDHAMAKADEDNILGDFQDATFTSKGVTTRFFRKDGRYMVNTEGPDGKMADFEIAYTFGWDPLQQYLVPFSGGRLQCLSIAWDKDSGQWFDLYPDKKIPPDDWLHWTRAAQNWNGMCAECHSTNLKKGFAPDTKTYKTTWSEINVSCEACHGPGSRHVDWANVQPMARPPIENFGLVVDTKKLDAEGEVELCAPCHSRRTELGDYDHTQAALLDHQLPSLLEENLYYADGQILDEVYVWGSFTQSKMFAKGVRCSDCHDVHSLQHHFQGNKLCLQCHRADAYDSKVHHFHKKIHENKPSDGARCVKCHLPERAYMVIDERADHSIRIPRPDLTQTIGTPNACSQAGCHDKESLDWVLDAFTKWYGEAKKPHFAPVFAAGRKGLPEAEKELVRMSGDQLLPAVVRATALSLLAGNPSERSTRAFKNAILDSEALVRYTAVDNIMLPDSNELIKLLSPLLFDPLKAVRMQAAVRLADAPKSSLKAYQKTALEKALDEYEQAMTHALDFSFAGHNLGNLYSRLNNPIKAEKYYRDAIAIDDQFYPAKVNLAVLLNASGRNNESENLLREVVSAHPDQYQAAYSLGLLLAELGNYKEAEHFLSRAATSMPGHPGVRRNLNAIRDYLEKVKNASP